MIGFVNNYEADIKYRIRFSEEIKRVDIKRRVVFTEKGNYKYDTLVNTIPLKNFISMIDNGRDYFPEAENLEHISTVVVNLILKKRRRRFHWVYIPQPEVPFYRAGYYPGRDLPFCYLERSVIPGKYPSVNRIEEDAIRTLKKLKLILSEDEIKVMDIKFIPVSYIIFNRSWENDVPSLIKKLKGFGVESTGRFGTWDYSSMSDDIKSAIEIAKKLNGKWS